MWALLGLNVNTASKYVGFPKVYLFLLKKYLKHICFKIFNATGKWSHVQSTKQQDKKNPISQIYLICDPLAYLI